MQKQYHHEQGVILHHDNGLSLAELLDHLALYIVIPNLVGENLFQHVTENTLSSIGIYERG